MSPDFRSIKYVNNGIEIGDTPSQKNAIQEEIIINKYSPNYGKRSSVKKISKFLVI